MIKIALSEAPAGSVLASPVLDTKGRILLKEGAVLSPQLAKKLGKWGVLEVEIVGSAPEEAAEPCASSAARPATSSTPWTELFAPYEADPEMNLIHGALRTWKATRVVDAP